MNVDELKFVMRHLEDKMTEEEIEEMIREADHDNDGQISYDGERTITFCIFSKAIIVVNHLNLLQGMDFTVHKPHPFNSHTCTWQGVL